MKQCSWGECKEPATQVVRWSNEEPKKPNQVAQPAKPTLASYCDVCVQEATRHGAALVGPYDPPKITNPTGEVTGKVGR